MTDSLITHRFQTPRGWESGHLQTIRSRVVRRRHDVEGLGNRRWLLVDLDDGTGDRLAVQVHKPHQALPVGATAALVLLIHGLGGSAESAYVRATAAGLLAAGISVARVDLRGTGESAKTSAAYYHAGRTDDLRAVINRLACEPEAAGRGGDPRIAVVGFSLGGNMTIKLMGEGSTGVPAVSAVAVSAPLDLTVGSVHLNRRSFGMYEKFLLAELKRQSLEPGPNGMARLTPAEQAAIRRARTLADFDDALTAPRNGWQDAAEYYAVNSSYQFLAGIDAPTLIIHSVDDPMIPVSPYQTVDWHALEAQGFVRRAITPRGGHVGFHEHGKALPWFVGQTARFLTEVR